MTRLLRLQCQKCMWIVPAPTGAPAAGRCSACGNSLVALGQLASAGRVQSRPARGRVSPGPGSRRGLRPRRWGLVSVTLMAVIGLLVIGGEVCYLEASRRRDAEQGANEAAAAEVQSARPLLARRRWNEAEAALAPSRSWPLRGATDFAGAGPLLERARLARAADLLASAETAWRNRQATEALRLLQAYLDDPSATQREQASRAARCH